MAERKQVYKCNRCGIVVEVLHDGPGQLVCCHADMELLEEKTADSTTEKHVPVVEKVEGGFKVTVGSVPHPMVEAHYIEWIELVADGIVYRKHLAFGDVAEAVFAIDAKNVTAREYCSVHGLWKS